MSQIPNNKTAPLFVASCHFIEVIGVLSAQFCQNRCFWFMWTACCNTVCHIKRNTKLDISLQWSSFYYFVDRQTWVDMWLELFWSVWFRTAVLCSYFFFSFCSIEFFCLCTTNEWYLILVPACENNTWQYATHLLMINFCSVIVAQ